MVTDNDIVKITNFKLNRGIDADTRNLAVGKECAGHSSPEILKKRNE